MKTDPASVHVLVVDHRHGRDTWVCATFESARRELADYCAAWWGDTGIEGDPPADADERIDAYFDALDGDELYSIDAYPIID